MFVVSEGVVMVILETESGWGQRQPYSSLLPSVSGGSGSNNGDGTSFSSKLRARAVSSCVVGAVGAEPVL